MGNQFVIKTDQQSLKFLLEQKIGTPSQQKWLSKLIGYDFVIEYKKGRDNLAADALSCMEEIDESEAVLTAITVLDPMWLKQLKDSYFHDEEIAEICRKLQQGDMVYKKYTHQNGFLLKKGKLFYQLILL